MFFFFLYSFGVDVKDCALKMGDSLMMSVWVLFILLYDDKRISSATLFTMFVSRLAELVGSKDSF